MLSLADFRKIVKYFIRGKSKLPVMIRGRHGVGKSEGVYQLALDLGGMTVLERRLSQMTEGDMIGLPDKDSESAGKYTRFLPAEMIYRACQEGVILFFDEADRGINEVRMGIMELTDSRKFYGNNLHPDTIIIAAINGGCNGPVGAQYSVNNFDPAELDRWVVLDLEPTIQEFLSWAADKEKGNFHPFLWNFLNENHAHIEYTSGPYQPTKVYPSRRSCKRLNDVLVGSELLEDAKANSHLIYQIAMGLVGHEAAVALSTYAATFAKAVQVSEVIKEGKLEAVKEFTASQHLEFIEKMDAEGVFKNDKITKKEMQNLAYYWGLVPSEHSQVILDRFSTQNKQNKIQDFMQMECDPTTKQLLAGTPDSRLIQYILAKPEVVGDAATAK